MLPQGWRELPESRELQKPAICAEFGGKNLGGAGERICVCVNTPKQTNSKGTPAVFKRFCRGFLLTATTLHD